jgi:arylformamidase
MINMERRKMKIIDISIPISENTIMWDDDFIPEIAQFASINKGDISNSSYIKMSLHTSTHIDFPLHFIENGKSSETIPIEKFYGKVFVAEMKNKPITAESLEKGEIPKGTKKLLLKTDNYLLYKNKGFSKDYNALDYSGAKWIIENRIELVGIDYLSIETYINDNYSVHKTLLKNDVLIVEGLNLENVKQGEYTLFALPLKIYGVEAAPVRAFILDNL